MNTADQSFAANSTKIDGEADQPDEQQHAPWPGEPRNVDLGCRACRRLRRRTRARQMPPAAAAVAATTANWIRGSMSARADSEPISAPASTPRLHMPCRPDMIDLPIRCSASTAWAFIALSFVPVSAPKISIIGTSTSRSGAIRGQHQDGAGGDDQHPGRRLGAVAVHELGREGHAVPARRCWSSDRPGPASRCSGAGGPAIHGSREANVPITVPFTKKRRRRPGVPLIPRSLQS